MVAFVFHSQLRWVLGVITILGIILAVVVGVKGCNEEKTVAAAEKAQADSGHQYVPVLVAECLTPCKMSVGWDTQIKTGGRPVLVRFFEKQKPLLLSGREDDRITLDQFNPGQAQFTSPNGTIIRIQLFQVR
jgi:hypothetical protein